MSLCWCINERTGHRRDEPCPEREYWLAVEDSERLYIEANE